MVAAARRCIARLLEQDEHVASSGRDRDRRAVPATLPIEPFHGRSPHRSICAGICSPAVAKTSTTYGAEPTSKLTVPEAGADSVMTTPDAGLAHVLVRVALGDPVRRRVAVGPGIVDESVRSPPRCRHRPGGSYDASVAIWIGRAPGGGRGAAPAAVVVTAAPAAAATVDRRRHRGRRGGSSPTARARRRCRSPAADR